MALEIGESILVITVMFEVEGGEGGGETRAWGKGGEAWGMVGLI